MTLLGNETISTSLPAVISADLRLNQPRFAKLQNIMKARKMPVEVLTPEALGVDMKPRLQVFSSFFPFDPDILSFQSLFPFSYKCTCFSEFIA